MNQRYTRARGYIVIAFAFRFRFRFHVAPACAFPAEESRERISYPLSLKARLSRSMVIASKKRYLGFVFVTFVRHACFESAVILAEMIVDG